MKTFFDLAALSNKTKGKGLAAVMASRGNYTDLIQYFGGSRDNLPSSVMKAAKAKLSKAFDAPGVDRSYSETSPLTKERKATRHRASTEAELRDPKRSKTLRATFQVSGSGAAADNISTFWQDVGRSIVLMYTKAGDTVVDPFAGHNSRMELCARCGRNYIGHDLSKDFMRFNRKRAKQLREEFPSLNIELHEGDSRKLAAKTECGDFTITSPPYWDIEDYGDEPEQLGKNTYEGFLEGMQQVMNENFRVLKPGAFAAYFINDFRRDGKFYPYHYDIMTLGVKAGFENWDMLIVDLGRGFGDIFINQYLAQMRLPKRHEYGVIFKKPSLNDNIKNDKDPKKRKSDRKA